MNHTHPNRPFDGQIFIDAHRVKWEYNSETKCWRRIGSVNDIPQASETQIGLLTAKHKSLIDTIAEKGGAFGLVTRPLLSVVPQNKEVLLADKVESSVVTESGSTIILKSALESALEENKFSGKFVQFISGVLKDQLFVIATNDDMSLKVLGDASASVPGDRLNIVDASAINLSGVISGDVQLVSESIDITCVDSENNEITTNNCSKLKKPDAEKYPALDFKVSELFKSTFCVQQPGCEGPRGEKGNKGKTGKHGTGDGPQGAIGNAGMDAPQIPFTFDGVKIVDIDDIYDTAVVSLEIDPATSKLNVVKAKMKTPDSEVPADQVVASEVFRSIDFTGDEWNYTIEMPTTDPTNVKDLLIAYYPQGLFTNSNFRDIQTVVCTMKLSEFISEVTKYYQILLDSINYEYDQQIKAFIESKDTEARKVLASLCQQQAECEWERPIEMCIGIKPNECNPLSGGGGGDFDSDLAKKKSLMGGGALNYYPQDGEEQEQEEEDDEVQYGLQISTPFGSVPLFQPYGNQEEENTPNPYQITGSSGPGILQPPPFPTSPAGDP
jgi:hypothetical protein